MAKPGERRASWGAAVVDGVYVGRVWRAWKRHEPLVEIWHTFDDAERRIALRVWLVEADNGDWAFADLRALLRMLLGTGGVDAVPPALHAWGLEVAAEIRVAPPPRTGPKGKPRRDFARAMDSILRVELGTAASYREAYKQIGAGQNQSPEAVASAVRRVRNPLPGV